MQHPQYPLGADSRAPETPKSMDTETLHVKHCVFTCNLCTSSHIPYIVLGYLQNLTVEMICQQLPGIPNQSCFWELSEGFFPEYFQSWLAVNCGCRIMENWLYVLNDCVSQRRRSGRRCQWAFILGPSGASSHPRHTEGC